VIADEIVEDRLAAVFLDSSDITSQAIVLLRYKRSFGGEVDHEKQVKRILYEMVRDERVIEHDVEGETLDNVIVDHAEYGQLDPKDLTFLSVDDLLAIGPELIHYTRARASQIAEQATGGGLNTAIEYLSQLPIDSSLWTGMPVGFKLDDQTKGQVIKLLRRADSEISAASVSNREVAQAKALITAALILTEAPEPESEIVWGLLQKLSVFVTLSQGIEGLLKLFKVI